MTDPTREICRNSEFGYGLLGSTVQEKTENGTIGLLNVTKYPQVWFPSTVFDRSEKFKAKITTVLDKTKVDPIYVDAKVYTDLQESKNYYERPGVLALLREYRDHIAINPFSQLPKQFLVRAGMKMANLNGVFLLLGDYDVRITNTVGLRYGSDNQSYDMAFAAPGVRFLDIGGAPGGFIEYIDKRVNGATGVSFSLKSKTGLSWDKDLLKRMGMRLVIDNGASGDGDIFKNWLGWSKQYKGQFDFVSGDIGFPTSDWLHKELIIQRAVIHELWLGTSCLKEGGNLVVKTMDLVTKGTAEILELFSRCYNMMYIIKPVTSRPTNEEKYVVLMGRQHDTIVDDLLDRLIPVLKRMNSKAKTSKKPVYIEGFRDPRNIDPKFLSWLTMINNVLVDEETFSTKNLIDSLMTGDPNQYLNQMTKDEKIHTYDISKALTVWNLDDIPGSMLPRF